MGTAVVWGRISSLCTLIVTIAAWPKHVFAKHQVKVGGRPTVTSNTLISFFFLSLSLSSLLLIRLVSDWVMLSIAGILIGAESKLIFFGGQTFKNVEGQTYWGLKMLGVKNVGD